VGRKWVRGVSGRSIREKEMEDSDRVAAKRTVVLAPHCHSKHIAVLDYTLRIPRDGCTHRGSPRHWGQRHKSAIAEQWPSSSRASGLHPLKAIGKQAAGSRRRMSYQGGETRATQSVRQARPRSPPPRGRSTGRRPCCCWSVGLWNTRRVIVKGARGASPPVCL